MGIVIHDICLGRFLALVSAAQEERISSQHFHKILITGMKCYNGLMSLYLCLSE